MSLNYPISGSGGSSAAKPGVTYMVAASDATAKVKRIADYVCDGTADDVEIQAAIDLCVGGETVQFTEGTYNISATVTSTASIALVGQYGQSKWYLVDGADCNMFSGLFKAFVGMELDGNRTNQAATSHLIVGTGGADVCVADCLLWYGNGDGLRIVDPAADMWTWRIHNTTFENLTTYGIHIAQSDSGRYIRNIQLHNLYIWLAREAGIFLSGASQNIHEVIVTGSRIGYTRDSLIEADDCKQVVVVGNCLDSPGSDADGNNAGVYLNDCAECVMADNAIYNSLGFVNGYGVELQGTTDRVALTGNTIYDSGGAWAGPVNLGAPNANGIIRDNVGFIAPGEVRSASGSLAAGNANAIAFAWHNPEAQDITIKKVVVEVMTAGGTVGSHLDVGIADDAAGTNRGTEFFDDLLLNSVQVNDSWVGGDGGTQTKWVFCQDSASATDGWVVGQILDANAASLVGSYYIEYVGR